MPRHALITGAHGFVGRHVARAAAAAGFFVTAIGHGAWSRDEYRQWGIGDWHTASLDMDALITHAGQADTIFHCAGSGSVAFSLSNPFQDFQRSVGTTLAVLEFARLHRPQARIVLPSSAGVYGITSPGPIGVNQPGAPVSPYGLHKRLAEDLVRSYARHYGLQVAITRLFSVYGIGLRKQLWWDACCKLSSGEFVFNGTGEETRDWLHVEDAARLMLTAAENASASCPVANGGNGEAVPIRAVVQALARELGHDAPVVFQGAPRPGDPSHYQADIREALAWGWKPQHHWEAQTAAYADWFRRGAP